MLFGVPGVAVEGDNMLPCSQPVAAMEPADDTTAWGTYWATAVPAVSDLMQPGSMVDEFNTTAAHDEHLGVPSSYTPHDLWSPLSSSGVCHRGDPYLSEDSLGLPHPPPLPALLSPVTSELAPGISSSEAGSCTEGGGSPADDSAGGAPQHGGETGGDASVVAPTQPVNDAVVHMTSLAKHFHVPRKEAAAGKLWTLCYECTSQDKVGESCGRLRRLRIWRECCSMLTSDTLAVLRLLLF